MKTEEILLLLYIGPIILNFLLLYLDKETKTLEHLFELWWLHFIPMINVFATGVMIVDLIFCQWLGNLTNKFNLFWDKIKHTKIK